RQAREGQTLLAGDGGKKAGRRGERAISRKTIAQGRPDALRWTCMLVCALLCANCTRDRGRSAHPVFPALSFRRAGSEWQTSSVVSRENAESYSVVIARLDPIK